MQHDYQDDPDAIPNITSAYMDFIDAWKVAEQVMPDTEFENPDDRHEVTMCLEQMLEALKDMTQYEDAAIRAALTEPQEHAA